MTEKTSVRLDHEKVKRDRIKIVLERLLEKITPSNRFLLDEQKDKPEIAELERLIIEELTNVGIKPKFKNIKECLAVLLMFGPIADLMYDDEVSEIMVNSARQVYVEIRGRLELTDKKFEGNNHLLYVIKRIVFATGRRISEASPMVDARLADGSRLNAVIPPLVVQGPTLTIRKFARGFLSMNDLIEKNSISENMVYFLKIAVLTRRNIIISGGTGAGKTTFLNILSSFIPEHERIVTIEDAAELQILQDHVVRMETRPPDLNGKGEITITDLFRNTLRMRPDRIIVGECRGAEALDMLQAMNTGHDGSLTTIHSNTPKDCLSRLETLIATARLGLPTLIIRKYIASAIQVVIQINRISDGSRKVTRITEITGQEGDVITTSDLFQFKESGQDKDGKVLGEFVPGGVIPKFYDELRRKNTSLDLNYDIFSP
ncbi:MAG: CpaF family protein [Planctomycetota bacterium]